MMTRVLTRLAAVFAGVPLLGGAAEAVWQYDFEQGAAPAAYAGLTFKDVDASVVSPGAEKRGHALCLRNAKASRYAQLTISRPFPLRKNLVLSFDHREEVEQGGAAAYVGVIFFDAAGKQWFTSDRFGAEWKHTEIVLGELHSSNGGELALGKVMEKINIYGRAKADTTAKMTVWLDNITLREQPPLARLSEEIRVSYSNPPFFNWPRARGQSKLQFSLDPTFPEGQTTTVSLEQNFYTPPQPIAPGVTYWRVSVFSELSDGWSEVRRINVLPEGHRFMTEPVSAAKVGALPRPRVIDLEAARKEHAGKDRAALVKAAEKLHRTGVPSDPPRYAPGNPDWPTWIDWYGKVHGGITSRTGMRLQQIAQLCALTREPQVIRWTKEMAFAAAAWNPKGGSAMDAGDIGAQHLLRGLNWCYDALYHDLSDAERAQLRAVLVARGQQFWERLNPFRGSEANNHPWLQTLALGEAGLVLIGDHDEAAAWAEFSRQLYLGRFLCCLGYQGDNNEGISYWGYGLGFVISYADLMKHVCGCDLFQHPWLNQTARFPMYTAPPGAWAVSFADTGKPNHGIQGPAETRQVRDLAVRTRDPYALWYSGASNAVDGLVPKPPVDLPQSIHYRHIGWAVFNTSLVDGREGATFALHSGPYYAGHQHADQNGFVIHAYGEKLAIDSGYYDWYGSPHFKEYSTTTRAHNTLLVNGRGQAFLQKGADGRIAAFYDSPAYGYTVGDAGNPLVYQGQVKRFERRALFIKPGFVVLHDLVQASNAPARLDWLLHTVAPVETDAAAQAFKFASGRAALQGRFLAPAKVGLAVTKGYPVEPVDGYSTRPVPAEKYAHEWTLTATPVVPAREEDIVTAMQIRRLELAAEAEARIEALAAENAFGVRIVTGAETQIVLFRKRDAQGVLRGGGLEAEAEVAAVCFQTQSGAVRHAFAASAKQVRFRGKELFQSASPAHWSQPAGKP